MMNTMIVKFKRPKETANKRRSSGGIKRIFELLAVTISGCFDSVWVVQLVLLVGSTSRRYWLTLPIRVVRPTMP